VKKLFLAIILSGGLGTVFSALAADQTVTMDIEKMTCALCPLTVSTAMKRVDGVKDVDVDFDSKKAVVTYDDSKTTATEVAQASTEVGYPATPISD